MYRGVLYEMEWPDAIAMYTCELVHTHFIVVTALAWSCVFYCLALGKALCYHTTEAGTIYMQSFCTLYYHAVQF